MADFYKLNDGCTKFRYLNLKNFTKETTIVLGIYPEISDLYDCLYEEISSCEYDIKKCNLSLILDEIFLFYKKYMYLFADDPYQYINDKIYITWFLNEIIYTQVDHKNFRIKKRLISFSEFIKALGEFCGGIAYSDKIVCEDDINSLIDQRLKEKYDNSTIIKTDIPECMLDTDVPVYIYSNFCNLKCIKEKHSIESISLYYQSISSNKVILLPVHYCENCKKHFIGKNTLRVYDEKLGKMLIRSFPCDDEKNTYNTEYDQFAKQSPLYSWGYNVVEGELKESERHAILKNLLDKKLMTYVEICKDLERNLNQFAGRSKYIRAIDKWEKDLRYISDYVIYGENT